MRERAATARGRPRGIADAETGDGVDLEGGYPKMLPGALRGTAQEGERCGSPPPRRMASAMRRPTISAASTRWSSARWE